MNSHAETMDVVFSITQTTGFNPICRNDLMIMKLLLSPQPRLGSLGSI